MMLEKVVAILGKAEGRRYVLRRSVRPACSIARAYKTYALELWEKKEPAGEMLWGASATGIYTGDCNKKALIEKAEEAFMEGLFKHLKGDDGI